MAFNLLKGKLGSIVANFALPPKRLYTWGYKPSGLTSRVLSNFLSKKIIYIEDGFIQSILGEKKKIPLSISNDKKSIYYNCTRRSQLEDLIIENLTNEEIIRAETIRKMWIEKRISKFNYIKEAKFIENKKYILVIDQTKGDLSIKYGDANEKTFEFMLNWAINKWKDYSIVIREHPEVVRGNKIGHYKKDRVDNKKVFLSSDIGNPCNLIENAEAICTVTSQIGFEALLWNKPTYVFGMPFYAGWGLTQDVLIKKQ